MELTTKKYLEDSIKSYDSYRGLDKIGKPNGLATLDENGKVVNTQLPSDVATLDEDGKVPVAELPDLLVYKDSSTGKINKSDLPDGITGGMIYNDTEYHYLQEGTNVSFGTFGDKLIVNASAPNLRVSADKETAEVKGKDPYIQSYDGTEIGSTVQFKAGDGIKIENSDTGSITITNTGTDVEISEVEGNIITKKDDGLYAKADSLTVDVPVLIDGDKYTQATIPTYEGYTTPSITMIAGSSDMLVAIGTMSLSTSPYTESGIGIIYSTDNGKTWQQSNITYDHERSTLTRIEYVNGKFFAFGEGFYPMYSDNGITWSLSFTGPNTIGNYFRLVYGKNCYLLASGGRAYYSIDNDTWVQISTSYAKSATDVAYNAYDGTYAVGNIGGGLWYTTDPSSETWDYSQAVGVSIDIYSIAVHDNKYYVASADGVYSGTITAWMSIPSSTTFWSLEEINGTLFGLASSKYIYVISEDSSYKETATDLDQTYLTQYSKLRDCMFGDGTYILYTNPSYETKYSIAGIKYTDISESIGWVKAALYTGNEWVISCRINRGAEGIWYSPNTTSNIVSDTVSNKTAYSSKKIEQIISDMGLTGFTFTIDSNNNALVISNGTYSWTISR